MENKKAERSPYTRPLRIVGWGTVVFFLGILLFSIYEPEDLSDRVNHALAWLAMGVIAAVIPGAALIAQKEAMWKARRGFQVQVLDGEIVCEGPDGSKAQIALKEIQKVHEGHGWLLVEGSDPPRRIAFPTAVDNFEKIRQEVAALCEIRRLKVKFSPQILLLFGLFIAAFVFLFLAHAKVVVISAAVILIVIEGFSMHRVRRLLQRRGKQWIVPFTFALFFLCVLLIVYQRFHSWK
jgi:hypothetical protein